MCGIYGIASVAPLQVAKVIANTDRMRHRGPDGAGIALFTRASEPWRGECGYWLACTLRASGDYEIALAHRRLAIIDPESGAQPMCNEDETVWVTFNGEIYNFAELRDDLVQHGHIFKSDHSDTEVIVHAWEEWGDQCVKRFNGMFAFALYDVRRKCIFVARDRVGKKPLYYRIAQGVFELASEIRALDSQCELEPRSLNFFLALGYVPHDRTLYQDVTKLPPAHAAVLDLNSWNLRVWRYWTLPTPAVDSGRKEDDFVDELESLLFDAVSLRLVSDVPLGVFLSGGLDSSLVAAMAARATRGKLRTFTITVPGFAQFDEAPFARSVAAYLGTDHLELAADPGTFETLGEVLAAMDEPIADSSLIPTWMVSRLSRRYVTVALGGDGGDELFGGYKHYLSALAASVRFARVPNAVWKLLANLAERLPAGVRGRNWLGSMRESPKYSAVWATPFFSTSMRRSLLAPELAQHLEDVWAEPEAWKRSLLGSEGHLLDQLTRLDFLSYLPDDIMAKVDRASMLNSLEVRAPWLDYRLVEFAFGQVPVSMKVRNGSGKHILKRLAARLLPPDFDADRKQGFSIPLDRWLRTAGDSAVRRQLPVDGTLFRTSAAGELLQGEHRGRSNGARLFALMCIHNVLGHARQRQSS